MLGSYLFCYFVFVVFYPNFSSWTLTSENCFWFSSHIHVVVRLYFGESSLSLLKDIFEPLRLLFFNATSRRRGVAVCGAACKQTFKRLSTHLSHSAACNVQYMTSYNPQQQLTDKARRTNFAALPTTTATPLSNKKNVASNCSKQPAGAGFTLPPPTDKQSCYS